MRGARFDPGRGRGRAARDRRGTGPRAQFSPGPSRPNSSGAHLSSSSLPQPDPGLARRHRADGADDLRAFYQAHYRPDGAVLVVVGDLDPDAALDRIPAISRMCPRAIRRGLGPRSSSPIKPAGAASSLPNRSRRRGASWAGAPFREPIAMLRFSTCSPISSAAAGDRVSGSRWSRPKSRHLDRDRPRGGAPGRPVFHPARGRPGHRHRRGRAANRGRAASPARNRPSAAELDRSRHRIKAAWRWEQEDLTSLAGGLGSAALWHDWRVWQAELRTSLSVEADDIRRVVETYLVDANLTVGWSLPSPSRERRPVRPGIRPRPCRRPSRLAVVSSHRVGTSCPRQRGTAPVETNPVGTDPLDGDRGDLAAR